MSGGREGWTTGTCAAAGAKAAALALLGEPVPMEVEVRLPDGARIAIPLIEAGRVGDGAQAAVRKDSGDDPDITNGAIVSVTLNHADGDAVEFHAGEGVGTVTLAGLAIAPGEPAINPVPRKMIEEAIRDVMSSGVKVTVSIPGGRALAAKTFNPRLGVEGGLSILGTTGRVRPFSCEAVRDTIRCALDVAHAAGVRCPVLVPGHIGERAARRHFRLRKVQVIEVSNEWGVAVDAARARRPEAILAMGHPGKLAKLAAGHWDTHSSRSPSAVPIVRDVIRDILGESPGVGATVEALLQALSADDRARVATALAQRIQTVLTDRARGEFPVAVGLIDLSGDMLGAWGDLSPWE